MCLLSTGNVYLMIKNNARLEAQGLPPLLFGGSVGMIFAFLSAWCALEVLRLVDDAMGNFTSEVRVLLAPVLTASKLTCAYIHLLVHDFICITPLMTYPCWTPHIDRRKLSIAKL